MKVLRPGLLTTVQDLGRPGYQRYGIGIGGAMDRFATRASNRLVGNPEDAAVLEITLLGPTVEFDRSALVAVCGGDLSPAVGERPLPQWRPVHVARGAVLTFGQPVSGCRAYLAIAGGIDVPAVLGGRGTHLRAQFGGLSGRALRVGDVLGAGAPSEIARELVAKLPLSGSQISAVEWSLSRTGIPAYRSNPTVRIIPGSAFDLLTAASQTQLVSSAFTVTAESDRMGYRLKGAGLEFTKSVEGISEPVCFGTIQLPPAGNPVVLMADCQTTGGYLRIAHAISVDQPLLAQLKPGDTIRFSLTSLSEAQRLHVAGHKQWEQLAKGIAWQIAST